MFARQGADWDDKDEKLSVEILKAMAWRVGDDADEYIIMARMPHGNRSIEECNDIELVVKSRDGWVDLDVIRFEDLDEYLVG